VHSYYVVAGATTVLSHNCGEEINPHEVRFSQDSVSNNFSDGHTIEQTASALRSGSLSRHDLPKIRLVEHEGNLFTLDNRRLVAFQQANLDSVPYRMATGKEIAKEFTRKNKFTTVTNGIGILIRRVGWHGPRG
jgi:hypothetical protein